MVWVRVGLCLGWVTAGVSFEIRTDGWLRFSCGWVWLNFIEVGLGLGWVLVGFELSLGRVCLMLGTEVV